MKKTLSALLVAGMFTATAQATTIYQKDGASVDVYGRFGAALDKGKNTDFDLKDDESRVGLKVDYDLGNRFHALGGVEFRFADEKGRFSDPTTHDAYVGLKHLDYGALTLGRQATTADDLALSKYAYHREDVTTLPKQGDRTVKFRSAEFGNDAYGRVSLGVDYTFLGSNDKDRDVKSKSVGTGLFYTNQFGDVGFKFNAGFSDTKLDDNAYYGIESSVSTREVKRKDWMVGTELTYQKFAMAVDYAHTDSKSKVLTTGASDPKVKGDVVQVALKYNIIPEMNVFTSYQQGKSKTDASDVDGLSAKYNQYTIGVDYKLHKNVVTYAQVDFMKLKDKNTGESSKDTGGSVGLRVYF